ncbi:hypothetical protein V8G57_08120 [Collimonas sp. H4R21]|uniref:Uncharacterized protein n=1 Tax=Collimonas rhizosphaerae TaxID=3126357 RepID=A0ABU9PTL5_9BURK
MQTKNYTSENICRSLGMDGFANDRHLAKADEAVRLLLKPSFHPEVCVSFIRSGYDVSLYVEAARMQIWQQDWPTPQPTPTNTAAGLCSLEDFETLVDMLCKAANPNATPRFYVIDGMLAHSILRREREGLVNINANAVYETQYMTFIAKAIGIAWYGISVPVVRNALRLAGGYVNVNLPEENIPPSKPVIRTVVLGSKDVGAEISIALKKVHK